jgi:hypothetical protein
MATAFRSIQAEFSVGQLSCTLQSWDKENQSLLDRDREYVSLHFSNSPPGPGRARTDSPCSSSDSQIYRHCILNKEDEKTYLVLQSLLWCWLLSGPTGRNAQGVHPAASHCGKQP